MSTTAPRRPLVQRPHLSHNGGRAPVRAPSSGAKRPRSPEPEYTSSQIKRSRASTKWTRDTLTWQEKGERVAAREREQQRLEFKDKYSRAFPSWSFYFDNENISMKQTQLAVLVNRIGQLHGNVDDFFSKEVTHLITDKPIPSTGSAKENKPNSRNQSTKRSPVVHKSRGGPEVSRNGDVIAKAISLDIKIWTTVKLDSVLNRCLELKSVIPGPEPKAVAAPTQKLERLLSREKQHGPSDRDLTQRRHDYRYFSKNSFFVLVEDIMGTVATIAAHEYPAPKDKGRPSWPVLYCHPHSRGPFIEFDEKEKQRWERAEQKKLEEAQAPVEKKVRPRKPKLSMSKEQLLNKANKPFDLRRSVSLNNLKRQQLESPEALERDIEGDVFDSANASGYLVSGAAYMAASGNSVGITSTTGTTSTAGGLRHSQLSASLEVAMKRQVVTSKKVASTSVKSEKRLGNMDPPPIVPVKQPGMPALKKSKSMNFKPPKREEGSKPGYCECCRQKFDDFKTHVRSGRHRRFALNEDNFLGLDAILNRVQRRTKQEKLEEEERRIEECRRRCSGLASSSPTALTFPSGSTP